MVKRSKITTLPKEVRAWLDRAIAEKNFSAYERLTAEANARLVAAGYTMTLSKSGLHRYGAQLERRMAAIKASTEAAAMIADVAPDDEDKRSGAVLSLIQTEIFEAIMRLQEAEDADPAQRMKLLSAAAKNIATMTRASVTLKRFQAEVREKARLVADAVARIAKKGGMSKDAQDEIRNRILGIATT